MIYLDSSALVKLVVTEPETPHLVSWLKNHPGVDRATSWLARVEVVRAVLEDGEAAVQLARAVLLELDQMSITPDLLDEAGVLTQPLRSLDAIHLASAKRLAPDLTAFVACDKRLLAAADQAGLPIASPGAT